MGHDPNTRRVAVRVALPAWVGPARLAVGRDLALVQDSADQGPEDLAAHGPVRVELRLLEKHRDRSVPQTIAAAAVVSSIQKRRKAR